MRGPDLKLAKGDWVFHPRMPDWGYGKVMEILSGSKGRVFFLLAGEKKLSWEHAGLDKVENDDTVSQAALNEQLSEFKMRLAVDLLTSEECSRGVASTMCESLGSKCELCNCTSENLHVYSSAQKGKLCVCDACRDKILLEAKSQAAINQDSLEEGESEKPAGDKKKPRRTVSRKKVKAAV